MAITHLMTKEGIKEIPKQKGKIRKLFCKHHTIINGISCSSIGLQRISGEDYYEVCSVCGKVLKENHKNYNE